MDLKKRCRSSLQSDCNNGTIEPERQQPHKQEQQEYKQVQEQLQQLKEKEEEEEQEQEQEQQQHQQQDSKDVLRGNIHGHGMVVVLDVGRTEPSSLHFGGVTGGRDFPHPRWDPDDPELS